MPNDLKMSSKVLFTGSLYEREKLRAYIDADVCVLPSSYDIFGITVLEAMACGIPVIVTDRCGIANVIDGKVGFAVAHDEEQLSNAILHVLGDDKMRLQLGEGGKALVHEKFNWQQITEQVELVYKAILK